MRDRERESVCGGGGSVGWCARARVCACVCLAHARACVLT